MSHAPKNSRRLLSHDEVKAAEAAFQGQPFNDDWSESARLVYDGMLSAICKRNEQRREVQATLDVDEADYVSTLLLREEMAEEVSAAVERVKRLLNQGFAALVGLVLLWSLMPQPVEAGPSDGRREQLIPILGVTMTQAPTGIVANLIVSFEERLDSSGLMVHFKTTPGRFSRMAQTAVEQAIYRTARAAGLSTDSWTVSLSVPYAGMTVYGESLSAMVALVVVALAKGEMIPPDRVMTGAVSSEGRIVPVGAVPIKVMAANAAHMHRVLVPDEVDTADADWATPFLVQVSPVGSIFQAYEALTDRPLRP